MNRLFKILISVSFLLIMISACSNSSNDTSTNSDSNDQDGDKIILRVSSGLPDVHSWFTVYFKPWMEQIEEETNGVVEFEVFSGGSLVPIEGEVDALKSGTI